ncbi:MAG TPA: tRNA pseudouridine(55) synthase TruB [Solimonas sp.]|nr:tRNA pseudouridine(55) synthase TruB [Solimonas sp.]
MSAPRRTPRRELSGILLLDKPTGISSNDALQRAKRIFRAAKAGHTGSLDPLATGVLPLCFGEATKLCGVLLESDKVYRARARLGVRTATGDSEGEPVAHSAALLDRAGLEAVLPRFLGALRQIPPMYSALKREGRPLYELARAGIEVEREARDIVVHRLELLSFGEGHFEVEVHCSKGTYIRTLVEDLAAAAGECAHLVALRRTAVTPFAGHPLADFAALEAAAEAGEGALDALLLSPAEGLRHWPSVRVDPAQAAALAQGKAVSLDGLPTHDRLAVLDGDGALLGLAESREGGCIQPRRWLVRAAAACG